MGLINAVQFGSVPREVNYGNDTSVMVEVRWRPTVPDPSKPAGVWQTLMVPVTTKVVPMPALARNVEYTIEARLVSTKTGRVSSWTTVTQTIDGVTLAPSMPINLAGEGTADGVFLTWTVSGRVPTHVVYEVQRSDDNTFTTPTTVGSPRAVSFLDPITTGNTYWYRVRSVDYLGTSSNWTAGIQVKAKEVADGADVSTNNTPTPVLNAFFAAGDIHWYRDGGWTITTDPGMDASPGLARKTGFGAGYLINNGKMPVAKGTDVSVRIYATTVGTTTGTIQVGVRYFAVTGLPVGNTVFSGTKAPNTTWFDVTLQTTAPEFAAYAQLVVYVENHTQGEWQVDNASMATTLLDAGTQLGDLSNQNILTVSEKAAVISEYNAIASEFQGIYDQGTLWNNTAERDAYGHATTGAKKALDDHLALQNSPVLWSNTTDKTNLVVGTTGQANGMLALRYRFNQYYVARQNLLNANAADAKQASVDAQSAATTATTTANGKNKVFYSAAAPTNPIAGYSLVAGDLWFDQDDYNTPYRWNGSAWISVRDLTPTASENIVANSSFESATGGTPDFWATATGVSSLTQDVAGSGMDGGRAAKLVAAGGSAQMLISGTKRGWLAGGGKKATISFYIKKDPSTPAGSAYLYLESFSSETGGAVVDLYGSISTAVTSSWQRVSVTVTVFNTREWHSPRIGFQASSGTIPAGAAVWIDRVQIEEGDVMNAWKPRAAELLPGSILETHIGPQQITTPLLATNAVATNKLAIVPGALALTQDPNCTGTDAWEVDTGRSPTGTFSVVDVTQVEGDGSTGNKALRSGNNVACWVRGKQSIPIDPGKTYRVTGQFRGTAGAGYYLAVILEDANGNNLDGTASGWGGGGWAWYPTTGGAGATSNWARTVASFGSGTAKPIPAAAKFFRIGAILNLDNTVNPGYVEVQDLKISEVLHGEMVVDGTLTVAKMYSPDIQAGLFTADVIKTTGYQEDAYGNPITGAKLDRNGTALKVAPGSLQTGARAIVTVTTTGSLVNADFKNVASVVNDTSTGPDTLHVTFANAFPNSDYLVLGTYEYFYNGLAAWNMEPLTFISQKRLPGECWVGVWRDTGGTGGYLNPIAAPATGWTIRLTLAFIQIW